MLWLLSTKSSLKGVPVGKGSSVRVSKVVARVADDLRWHTTRRVLVGKVHQTALDVLLARAAEVIAIGSLPSDDVDGRPATAPMNGSPGTGQSGGRMMEIADGGELDHVPTSSTESAAFARLSRPVSGDSAADIAELVVVKLGAARSALTAVDEAIQRFDRLRSTKDLADPAQCYVAQVVCGLKPDLMWERYRLTDFKNRQGDSLIDPPWSEPRWVCESVYWFVRNHRALRRLPNVEELQSWLERGSSKVRAS